jgi:tetrahydromethanopterin S-methyltransferase subunit G
MVDMQLLPKQVIVIGDRDLSVAYAVVIGLTIMVIKIAISVILREKS